MYLNDRQLDRRLPIKLDSTDHKIQNEREKEGYGLIDFDINFYLQYGSFDHDVRSSLFTFTILAGKT